MSERPAGRSEHRSGRLVEQRRSMISLGADSVNLGGVQRLAGGVGGGDLTAWTLTGRLLAQKSAETG